MLSAWWVCVSWWVGVCVYVRQTWEWTRLYALRSHSLYKYVLLQPRTKVTSLKAHQYSVEILHMLNKSPLPFNIMLHILAFLSDYFFLT